MLLLLIFCSVLISRKLFSKNHIKFQILKVHTMKLCSKYIIQNLIIKISIRIQQKSINKWTEISKAGKEIQIIMQLLIQIKQSMILIILLNCCSGLYLKQNFKSSYQYFVQFMSNQFGIEAIEIYFPKTFVDQAQFQKFNKVSIGKYTNGLGQLELSFAYPFQDVNSFSLTAVSRLLRNNNIKPSQIGRLEVGTETLIDKSKSSKTVLMQLFKDNHDIEGATSINACYGATNALINTLNWITSPSWDGRYGIVVASDLAVYQKGPARCTGGAGAIAMLIGPKAKVSFNKQRCSFMDHRYDFYKPNPHSQYPIVDGKISIDCYLEAISHCYGGLKNKLGGKNLLRDIDYFCFHSPFYKMVQKAFNKMAKVQNSELNDKQIEELFMRKVHPCMYISQRVGNIYTGSVFSTLIGLMMTQKQLNGKNIALFSYGSGLCSTLLTGKIHKNLLKPQQIQLIRQRLNKRLKIDPQEYDRVMLQRQQNYGKYFGKIKIQFDKLDQDVYYLSQIDDKWRRKYECRNIHINMTADKISSQKILQRIQSLDKKIPIDDSKFYKIPIADRIDIVNSKIDNKMDVNDLLNGGLKLNVADTMTENVIGLLSLPLSVVPEFVINKKKIMIPMCIEEPSVVAACSSIGKFIAPFSFSSSSTPSIMTGQVHIPSCQPQQIHQILIKRQKLIDILNSMCLQMVKRGGGVTDIRVRQLNGINSKQYVLDVIVNVCDAMGANIVNTLCERLKTQIMKMGLMTGIAILSNYCTERKAIGWFEIPTKLMSRKGYQGGDVARKILEAYQFAKKDVYRASTHNKGIMNGIDSVCIATGQDWRAVQASAHTYATRTGKYMPLTHYQIIERNGQQYFKGSLQLPIAVGSVGGVISKNPLYKSTFELMGNPNAQELSQILVCVGLAQNFAALRALAIQGIQNGHMKLHGRTIAKNAGVPDHLVTQACEYMTIMKKYDEQTCKRFLDVYMKPKL